jgi:hypothetical protein
MKIASAPIPSSLQAEAGVAEALSSPDLSAKSSFMRLGFGSSVLTSFYFFRIQHCCGGWHLDSGQKSCSFSARFHPLCSFDVYRSVGLQGSDENAVRT